MQSNRLTHLLSCITALSLPLALSTANAKDKGGNLLSEPVKVTLKMGEKREDWPHNKWQKIELPSPVDLSSYDGLLVKVKTDQPRSDAGVYVALQEADGTWRYASWASDLTQKENTGKLTFEEMSLPLYSFPGNWRDENDRLDPEAIKGIAFGTINPLGVGDVSFTVDSIEPFTVAGKRDRTAEPLTVAVGGKGLNVNGQTMIPRGLFGSFNLKKGHTEKYRLSVDRRIHFNPTKNAPQYGNEITNIMVNTIGDRVQPSIRLSDKDWKTKLEALGRKYGEVSLKRQKEGEVTYVEWWNEPYLNWANDNRASFLPTLYDVSKAEEGGPVHIKHDGVVAPHLKWTKDPEIARANSHWWLKKYERQHGADRDHWMRGKDSSGKVYSTSAKPYHANRPSGLYGGKWAPHTHPPKGTREGETYTIGKGDKQKELTAFTPWYIYDETQHTYRSGMGMVMLYNEPMLAFGEAAKKVDPNIFFIAGWGTRPSEDNWSSWDLYKATIDEGISIIDAVGDHDYGGSPTRLAANYEVVTAYGVTQHGKWLYGVNTETASSTDPQAYANATASPVLGKFKWTAAKMLYNLEMVPDKAKIFMWFGMGGGFWEDAGEGVFFDMTNNLRGKMLQVKKPIGGANDKRLVVASIDGTDPKSPRPEEMGPGKEMVVAIYNMDSVARKVEMDITAPGEATFSGLEVQMSGVTGDGKPTITQQTIKPTTASTHQFREDIQPGQLVVLSFPLRGELGDLAEVVRDQVFLESVLVEVKPDLPINETVAIPEKSLKGASRAWLQFVAENIGHDEAELIINGKTYQMPAVMSPANTPVLVRMPVEVDGLKPSNTVEIKAAPNAAGFLLASAGFVVERTNE